MNINETQAQTHQPVPLNKSEDFLMCDYTGLGQFFQQGQHQGPVFEIAARHFTDDQRVAKNELKTQEIVQPLIMAAQMRNPHRRINQNHIKTCDGGRV